jgi:ER membrane protein complex subunit 3
MRKHTLSSTNEGVLRSVVAPEQGDAMEKMMSNPMMNPNMMGGMLKNNLFMTIMTPLQYGLINHFFSGFIIGKVPFPLTQTFRSMLQSGVSVLGLDVKYVSSLSLYFLSFSGFNSIYQLIFQGE